MPTRTKIVPTAYSRRCSDMSAAMTRSCRRTFAIIPCGTVVAMIWPLLVVVGAVAGLSVYERFAGEHPLLDTWYEIRLRRMTLATLDRRNLERRRRADVIVTLTTLPSRIDRIGPTIKSLLNQTVSPAAIRINLPPASRREGRGYVVP